MVRTSAGRFIWVDDDAVLLGEMIPTDQMPPFFLRGWNEDEEKQREKRIGAGAESSWSCDVTGTPLDCPASQRGQPHRHSRCAGTTRR